MPNDSPEPDPQPTPEPVTDEDIELRRLAEESLRARVPSVGDRRSDSDTTRLVHELQVHQIELEMQNEELRRVQAELQAALRHYTELFDFAPIGYVTLMPDSTIESINLAGARLLGLDRAALVGRHFGKLVPSADRQAFVAFLEDAFAKADRSICEVTVLRADGVQLSVRIEAEGRVGQRACRAAVLDVTDRRHAQDERELLIEQLRSALSHVKLLSGLLPMCANCKKIQDEQGVWKEVHSYVSSHSDAVFTHGLCPECVRELYHDLDITDPEPPR
jgi:PAS domain S-box-containing protein